MGESKPLVEVASGPVQIDKPASGVDQKEKEKYQSQPEEKVAIGDYLVCQCKVKVLLWGILTSI